MVTVTYMTAIVPKSLRDQIMLVLWKGMLNGFQSVSLEAYTLTHAQQIHFLTTSGYIKHEGDGKFSLTKIGQARLEAAYKRLPSNAGFTVGEVE